jgi:hypothetical protein
MFPELSGLRSLEVAFPPHDSSDAGSIPAEVVEFLRMEKFREQIYCTLKNLKPQGGLWAKLSAISRPQFR